jgi:hypothetical protein
VKRLPGQMDLPGYSSSEADPVRLFSPILPEIAPSSDSIEPSCPLGCKGQPLFQGRRNRLNRYECSECHLAFEVATAPRGGSS